MMDQVFPFSSRLNKPKVVIVNACYSSVIAKAFQIKGIPYAIGINSA